MKNRKRFLAMLLAGTMTAGCLAGCGLSNEKQESSKQQESSAEQTANSTSQEISEESAAEGKQQPITTDPITISILTTRHTNATNDASDLWCFKYLEYWMNEQGYNITIDVQQTLETDQQISLLLGTDSLPDIVWGITLSEGNSVVYGAGEEMILDWTPYLNEETMPNLYSTFQENPNALAASTCIDGGVYGLPYVTLNKYRTSTGGFGIADRLYVNSEWLEEFDLEMPTDIEGFLDTLRTFKENKKLESGEDVIPLVSNADFFQKFLWIGLGFYGSDLSAYGTVFAIKDGQVTLPAATEDYRTFIEVMKTCYEEGLISKDFFTMDTTTARGLTKAGSCGMLGDYTLQHVEDFSDWVAVPFIKLGDNDEVAVSSANTYRSNMVWVSADTEYPEVIAYMLDYMYSEEGAVMLRQGPIEGEDPLGLVDGWFYDENGKLSTKLVADGTYESYELYARQYIYPYDYVGDISALESYSKKLSGIDTGELESVNLTDSITGETIETVVVTDYKEDDVTGWWVITTTDAHGEDVTTIRLPGAYMSESDALRATELATVLNQYIQAESAKFITGIRPLSELDAYYEELKRLGVDEYIELYRAAYSTYMDSFF